MALTPPIVQTLHQDVKKLLDLWMRVRLVMIKAYGSETIVEDQEKSFLELKSEIQRLNRGISEEMTRGLQYDGEMMIEMMKNAINMEQLRNQPVKERQKSLAAWHQIYIKITRALGALEVIEAGYYPMEHRSMLAQSKAGSKK